MAARARVAPKAKLEAAEAARWIAKDNLAAARRFRQAIDQLTVKLGDFPGLGATQTHLLPTRYRFAVVPGFPYIAIYIDDPVPPVIIRILHGARDLPAILRDLQAPD